MIKAILTEYGKTKLKPSATTQCARRLFSILLVFQVCCLSLGKIVIFITGFDNRYFFNDVILLFACFMLSGVFFKTIITKLYKFNYKKFDMVPKTQISTAFSFKIFGSIRTTV